MPRLFLIDQSLNEEGGHPSALAAMLADTCRSRKIPCFVASGERFHPAGTALYATSVEPLFRYSSREKLKSRAHLPEPEQNPGFLARWQYRSELRRRVSDFSNGLQEFFRRHPLQPEDHVFLSTMRLFDTRTLLKALPRIRGADAAAWHLLFHRSEIAPRGIQHAEYRDVVDKFQSWLERIRNLSGRYRIRSYATTIQLTQELPQLQLPVCRVLPYPASSEFRPRPGPRKNDGPLRVLFAGAFRREKLDFNLQHLIDRLWPDLLSTGRVRLVIQGARDPMNTQRDAQEFFFGEPSNRQPVDYESENPGAPVVCLPHPLSQEEYLRQFHLSDIGLAIYDPDAYAKRYSGILGEFLSIGRPVITSGRCGPGDEIHRITVRNLLDSGIGPFDPGATYSANPKGSLAADLPGPIQAGHDCLMSFDWECDSLAESHLEVTLSGVDLDGRPVSLTEVVGAIDVNEPIRLAIEGAELPYDRLQLRARAIDSGCRLTGGRAAFVERPRSLPRDGRLAVGLVAQDLPGVVGRVRRLVNEYPAWREAAERAAPGWHAAHRPDALLDILLAGDKAVTSDDEPLSP